MPKHSETRKLPYTADQMFDLVAEVERYPEFLPWTAAARVASREQTPEGEIVIADLVVSFQVFREKFKSRVLLHPGRDQIDTSYLDGPFKYLNSIWRFRDLAQDGVEVHFEVDFEFRNPILGAAAQMFFTAAMQQIVRAFESQAAKQYGTA
ncbi:type II toxin-antitoxin system RatA family toxin [Palleronia caenipelagi]|uniref:Type II toxin-antitoxin system RatA family toxin n=1 Tax=Palleronia caenipelagi TaxID=2489174 RepID=A0A547PNJ2_9RHOB|nr:type II toxin-antitoxin system RatA family toxin [Palleronia caenipelagi]TRD15717.1 type II toxin-antitoxin system RatA family toxin [Palleronia caenipelagi]